MDRQKMTGQRNELLSFFRADLQESLQIPSQGFPRRFADPIEKV